MNQQQKHVPERELRSQLVGLPKPYTLWVHACSGVVYTVVACGVDEATLLPVVVYRKTMVDPALVGEDDLPALPWVRPYFPAEGQKSWTDTVTLPDGRQCPRFVRAGQKPASASEDSS